MPFVKGRSGNPRGRPHPGEAIKDILNTIGREKISTSRGNIKMREVMLRTVYKQAIEGDVKAANFIAERTEGKVPDNINLEHSGVIENKIIFNCLSPTTQAVVEKLNENLKNGI